MGLAHKSFGSHNIYVAPISILEQKPLYLFMEKNYYTHYYTIFELKSWIEKMISILKSCFQLTISVQKMSILHYVSRTKPIHTNQT